jgi:hypothetical protein
MGKRPSWAAALLVLCLYMLPAAAHAARWCDKPSYFGVSLCWFVDNFLNTNKGSANGIAKSLEDCLATPMPQQLICAAQLGIDLADCLGSYDKFLACAEKAAREKGIVKPDAAKSAYWGVGLDKQAPCYREQRNYYDVKKQADRAETDFARAQHKFDRILDRHERGLLRLRSKVSQAEGNMLGVLAEFGISVATPFLNKVTCDDVALEQFCADLKRGETVKLARMYARALGERSARIKDLLNTDKIGLPRISRAQARLQNSYNLLENAVKFEYIKYGEMRQCQIAGSPGEPRMTAADLTNLKPQPYEPLVAKPNGAGCWEIPFTGIIFC